MGLRLGVWSEVMGVGAKKLLIDGSDLEVGLGLGSGLELGLGLGVWVGSRPG